MADAFSRYVRVLHSSLGHPKFLGLTAAERGTWAVALVLADIAHPEPVHEAAVRMHCPDAAFERLYERRLLELEGDGWFRVHDLRQFHIAPSETREAAAERQRRSRARRRKEGSVTPVTDVTSVTDVTTDDDDNDDDSIQPERRVRESESPASAPRRPTVRGFKGPIEAAG